MTHQNKRYATDTLMNVDNSIINMFRELYQRAENERVSTLPMDINPKTNAIALYSYGDALLFELSMMIRGHKPKEASDVMGVSYQTLVRLLNKYQRGFADGQVRVEKGNAYVLAQMINYCYDTQRYLTNMIER